MAQSNRDDKYTHRHALEEFKHYPIDRSGYTTDELSFSNKAIVRALQHSRATITKAAIRQGQDVSDFMVQVLPCVELVEVDRNECPCAPASGCYWLRTKEPVPEDIQMISVTGVVPNGESPRFTELKWDRFQYIPTARNKATREGLYWSTKKSNDDRPYMYFYGNRFLEAAAIAMIAEDPMLAATYPKCGKVDQEALCNPLDVGFYTDAWMRDAVLQSTWQKLLPIRAQAGLDILNDDSSFMNPLQTK